MGAVIWIYIEKMRSYLNKDTFFKKMKKKPVVQEVLDNLGNYSVDEIEKLPSNHFPKWVKEALVKIRNRGGRTADEEALRIATIMTEKSLSGNKE